MFGILLNFFYNFTFFKNLYDTAILPGIFVFEDKPICEFEIYHERDAR